jgi:hypothetical protein
MGAPCGDGDSVAVKAEIMIKPRKVFKTDLEKV